ncbi:hypothetical protein [uncultured Sphingomonas sp.]
MAPNPEAMLVTASGGLTSACDRFRLPLASPFVPALPFVPPFR